MEAKQREWLAVSPHNQAKEPQLKQGSPPLKVSALMHLNQYETCGLRRSEGVYIAELDSHPCQMPHLSVPGFTASLVTLAVSK